MAEEEVDFSKLPLEERCTHKNWKARVSAYDELNKIFTKIFDEKSPDWSRYGSWVRKFPTDSNAAAQEKALEVTLLYLQQAACAGKIVSEVMSGVVAKCITAAKAKSKELAVEITLTCVEIEKQEQVQEELMKGMEQKNPKVVAGCISILAQILREFGAKVINLKPLVKKIPTLAEDRDKTVREETKKLIIELYRWISAALKPQLSALKPVMLQELDTEFEKIANEKPQPTRLLRSQQAKAEEIAHGGGGDEAEDGEDVVDDAAPEIDPYDLMEAVDILSKIPKDFYEKCEAKKWQERKEALEALETLLNSPKIEPGDFSDLVRTLKKLVQKDTNILVVTLAGKCLASLASGLKKKFSPYAVACIGTILEKFKEKKANVVAAMRSAIDAAFEATNLEAIQEDVIQALQNKSPAVKTETCLFLARAFSKTSFKTMSDKKLMKGYFTAILACLNESDPGVRDAAAEAMGVSLKHVGEKTMGPFIADLDQLKLAKVKECCEKAVITAPKAPVEKKPKSAPKAESNGNGPPARKGPTIKKPATAPAASEKRSVLPKANKSGSDTNLSTDSPTSNTAPPAKKPGRQTLTKPAAKTSPNSKKPPEDPIGSNLPVNSPKQQRILDETRLKILRWTFTTPREEFIELLKELMTNGGIGKQLMTHMFSSDFKMHIRALDTLVEELNHGIDGTISNLDLILKWLTLRFFDTNPTVLIKSLDYLCQVFRTLGEVEYQMPDVEANAFIPFLMMKIGDPKDNVKTSVHNILRLVTLVHSPQRVFTFIMEGIKSKNARQRAECLEEIANMISTLGVSVIQPTPASGLKEIAKQIADRDNGVRNAALNAVVQVYFFEGEKVYKMIGQLPDKTQSLLDERIKRAGKQRPPPQQIQQPEPRSIRPPAASNNSSPNTTTLSPQGNSKLTPPSIVSNTILQPQNLNTTVTNATNMDMDEDGVLMPPPTATMGHNFGFQPPQPEPPKSHILPEKYRLNFEHIENMFRDDPPIPPLVLKETNVDALLAQKPPTLPTRKMIAPVAPNMAKDKNRPNQPPSKACQSIDLIIAQVGQHDLRSSMEALTQLDSMISDQSIVQIMSNRVDHMLSMTSLQVHKLQGTIESANPERLTEVNKFYRCAVAFLTSLYKGDFLPQKASKETIKDLIQNLLLLIIDPSLERLPDAAPIVRLINIMVVRIIEKSDPNAVTCALIRLLNETLTSSKQPRLLDLVMKCQWKLLKQFSVWEQWNYEWDITGILMEFNLFLRNHPFSSFQGQDITPLKTMKTILHALVVHLGGEVIGQHLSSIQGMQDSEAGLYINKVIQREMGKKRHGGGSGGTPNSRNGAGERSADPSSNHTSGRSNMSDNYNQVSNPNNNVNDFMNSLPDPSDAPTDEAREQVYIQRVRMILARGGLDIPRVPSVTLSKNMNDDGGESTI